MHLIVWLSVCSLLSNLPVGTPEISTMAEHRPLVLSFCRCRSVQSNAIFFVSGSLRFRDVITWKILDLWTFCCRCIILFPLHFQIKVQQVSNSKMTMQNHLAIILEITIIYFVNIFVHYLHLLTVPSVPCSCFK